eukprot:4061652-Alexandrium_andersonii.AAC.1
MAPRRNPRLSVLEGKRLRQSLRVWSLHLAKFAPPRQPAKFAPSLRSRRPLRATFQDAPACVCEPKSSVCQGWTPFNSL